MTDVMSSNGTTRLASLARPKIPGHELSERLAQLPIPELPRLAPIATEAIPHAPIAQAPAGDGHQARQSGAAQAAAPAIVENAMEAVALSFELLRLLLAEPLLVHCLLDVQRALRSQGTDKGDILCGIWVAFESAPGQHAVRPVLGSRTGTSGLILRPGLKMPTANGTTTTADALLVQQGPDVWIPTKQLRGWDAVRHAVPAVLGELCAWWMVKERPPLQRGEVASTMVNMSKSFTAYLNAFDEAPTHGKLDLTGFQRLLTAKWDQQARRALSNETKGHVRALAPHDVLGQLQLINAWLHKPAKPQANGQVAHPPSSGPGSGGHGDNSQGHRGTDSRKDTPDKGSSRGRDDSKGSRGNTSTRTRDADNGYHRQHSTASEKSPRRRSRSRERRRSRSPARRRSPERRRRSRSRSRSCSRDRDPRRRDKESPREPKSDEKASKPAPAPGGASTPPAAPTPAPPTPAAADNTPTLSISMKSVNPAAPKTIAKATTLASPTPAQAHAAAKKQDLLLRSAQLPAGPKPAPHSGRTPGKGAVMKPQRAAPEAAPPAVTVPVVPMQQYNAPGWSQPQQYPNYAPAPAGPAPGGWGFPGFTPQQTITYAPSGAYGPQIFTPWAPAQTTHPAREESPGAPPGTAPVPPPPPGDPAAPPPPAPPPPSDFINPGRRSTADIPQQSLIAMGPTDTTTPPAPPAPPAPTGPTSLLDVLDVPEAPIVHISEGVSAGKGPASGAASQQAGEDMDPVAVGQFLAELSAEVAPGVGDDSEGGALHTLTSKLSEEELRKYEAPRKTDKLQSDTLRRTQAAIIRHLQSVYPAGVSLKELETGGSLEVPASLVKLLGGSAQAVVTCPASRRLIDLQGVCVYLKKGYVEEIHKDLKAADITPTDTQAAAKAAAPAKPADAEAPQPAASAAGAQDPSAQQRTPYYAAPAPTAAYEQPPYYAAYTDPQMYGAPYTHSMYGYGMPQQYDPWPQHHEPSWHHMQQPMHYPMQHQQPMPLFPLLGQQGVAGPHPPAHPPASTSPLPPHPIAAAATANTATPPLAPHPTVAAAAATAAAAAQPAGPASGQASSQGTPVAQAAVPVAAVTKPAAPVSGSTVPTLTVNIPPPEKPPPYKQRMLPSYLDVVIYYLSQRPGAQDTEEETLTHCPYPSSAIAQSLFVFHNRDMFVVKEDGGQRVYQLRELGVQRALELKEAGYEPPKLQEVRPHSKPGMDGAGTPGDAPTDRPLSLKDEVRMAYEKVLRGRRPPILRGLHPQRPPSAADSATDTGTEAGEHAGDPDAPAVLESVPEAPPQVASPC